MAEAANTTKTRKPSDSTTARPAAAPPEEPIEGEPPIVDPSDQEIEEWADHERERRKAWLAGPTAAERAAWAERERERRIADLGPEARAAEFARLGRRYGRETQLVAEGALSLLSTWSRHTLAELARAGEEWEEDATRSPRRRRVRLDDEER
ncbi:MAG: hypothetical protein ACC726_12125 [Chloroflexota bacterium]